MARTVFGWGAALAAAGFATACGTAGTAGTAQAPPSAPPVPRAGPQARAAAAVGTLAKALRNGDVESLCRPGAIFTPAVVAGMRGGGESCEGSLEVLGVLSHPPMLTVAGLRFEPDLATARVHVAGRSTIPLDIVRDGRRWLVSFSNGIDPITAIAQP